jgi:hypothetical protein
MAENNRNSKELCSTPQAYKGDEQVDKVRKYIEFREYSVVCTEAHSLKPGHMFHSWKCHHDTSTFIMCGVKGSLPHQQYQAFNRWTWTWTCTNCAEEKLGELFPIDHDVDGCLGARK